MRTDTLTGEIAKPHTAAAEFHLPLKQVVPRTAENRIDETLEFHCDEPPKIDRFELLQRIGVGGFGTVWKAHDQTLDRTVAIKVPRAAAPDERQARRFLQEARLASQLKHPGIVGVHEIGRFDESFYIVSDFIDGQTLGAWANQRRRTDDEVAAVCRAMATAIEHAHQMGVVHRDMKPSNVLVDLDDQPHITDFGLARRTEDAVTLTAEGHIVGTPAYMSPEQVSGDTRAVDHRTDIYALGVIMFEMLTGELPFRGSVQILIQQVLTSEAPRPRGLSSSIPRDLENICMKCLEKEPRRRYGSAAALADDLDRFLARQPVTARSVPAHVRAIRWCKRNALASVVSLSLMLVLLLGIVTTTGQWLRAEAAAQREARLRVELEQLTQQILSLAGRLQQLEEHEGIAASLATDKSNSVRAAERRRSYDSPEAQLTDLDSRRAPLAELQPRGADRATDGSHPVPAGRPVFDHVGRSLQRSSESAALQADAKRTLQRLDRISPALAQQCRGVFPQLGAD